MPHRSPIPYVPEPSPGLPCRNCLDPWHSAGDDCLEVCGHCGQNWHMADECGSAPRNRCRCRPFPQGHLVKRCTRACSPGECPAPHRGGLVTAMMCRARCCMCGLPGHAGRDCHLKACRCGRQHLTLEHMPMDRQCAVTNCPRWFCTKHCQACQAELGRLRDETCGRCGARQVLAIPEWKPRIDEKGQPDCEYLNASMAWGNSVHGKAIFGDLVGWMDESGRPDSAAAGDVRETGDTEG
ncbi:hypothetical protein EsH8_IX_000038 [Colletotrichum jinshuiense]